MPRAAPNVDRTLFLAALSALGPFCIDTYLPSMHAMARVFGIPLADVQQTLTVYMGMFAAMALWHGAIADAIGRRRTILGALSVFALASAGCALAPSIHALVLFRALQGLTAGTGMVVGRAIVRDVSEGAEAQRMLAAISIVFALAPAAAPVLGGWLEHFFGWRSVFVFMGLFSVAVGVWCWAALPETLPVDRRQPLRPAYLARSYARALSSASFMSGCVALTFGFSGFFLYVLSAPTFLMTHLGLRETEFFWLFGPNTVGMIAGAWLSRRLAGVVSPVRAIRWGWGVMALACAANLGLALFTAPRVPWSILPIALYSLGISLAAPSLTLLTLDLFPAQRGLAASCQSFLQSVGSAVNAGLLAPLFWSSVPRLALGQAILFLLGLAALAVHLRAQVGPREGRDEATADTEEKRGWIAPS